MRKQSAINTFFNVVRALFLREIQTRFGSRKMGYFWAIAEPSSYILIISGIKYLVFNNTMPGVDFVVFVAIGFIVFFLFRNILTSLMNSFEANNALFVYSQVKPIYTIISRTFVEFLISFVVYGLFFFIGWYFYFDILIFDVFNFILCVLWIMLFGFSIGLLLAVLSSFYEVIVRIVNILLTPLVFFSAIFYPVGSLPPLFRELILYNPVTHFMEFLHGSYIDVLTYKYVDFIYMMWWTIIPLFLAFYLYLNAERKIVST